MNDRNYSELIAKIDSILEGEDRVVSLLSNMSAIINQTFDFSWVGFYLVEDDDTLILGPFQGKLACSKIGFGKGVCGTSWKLKKTINVPNVHDFEGHIACSSTTLSEIVVPVFVNNKVYAVLDIDSDYLNTFNKQDEIGLEKISTLIGKRIEYIIN